MNNNINNSYTVDFNYNDYNYSINGNDSILLSLLLDKLCVNNEKIYNVTFSNNSYIKIEKIENDWKLISLLPFYSEEELVINNDIKIKVTDSTGTVSIHGVNWTYEYANPLTYAGDWFYTWQSSTVNYSLYGDTAGATKTVSSSSILYYMGDGSHSSTYTQCCRVDSVTHSNSALNDVWIKESIMPYPIFLNKNGGSGGWSTLYYQAGAWCSVSEAASVYWKKTVSNNIYYFQNRHCAPVDCIDDGSYIPATSLPTRTGYTFNGYWSATSGGTKYVNASGQFINNLFAAGLGAVTLYARWVANTYTVTLNKQSGSGGTSSVNITYGTAKGSYPTITLPTRSGYTFGGYYTSTGGGGTQYYDANGSSVRAWNIASNTTLYAKWVANTYKIRFTANGGTGTAPSDLTRTYGQSFSFPNNPFKKTNYIFKGWAYVQQGLNSSATTTATSGWGEGGTATTDNSGIVTTASDTTYAATWFGPCDATASGKNLSYTGAAQTGVSGANVAWTGTTSATNAGTYTAYATPTSGHYWSDGTNAKKTVTWYIKSGTANCVWVYDGSSFRVATPYVWNGSAWKPAVAYTWNGSAWKPGIN